MDLTTYVARLREELASAAELGGPDARALAERLIAPMESAFRLALLDALSTAADEITRDLAPGSVELRLRAGDPGFVVTPPPAEAPASDVAPSGATTAPPLAPEGEDGGVSRINFRLSEQLKARIEQAAASEGLSVNAWLVRATTAAVQPVPPSTSRAAVGGQRYTGWAR